MTKFSFSNIHFGYSPASSLLRPNDDAYGYEKGLLSTREKAANWRLYPHSLRPKIGAVTFGKAFGQRIHSLRQRAGLTQERLAELADIDRSYIQRIEAGLRTPSVEIVIKIQKGLKCGWDELFKSF